MNYNEKINYKTEDWFKNVDSIVKVNGYIHLDAWPPFLGFNSIPARDLFLFRNSSPAKRKVNK